MTETGMVLSNPLDPQARRPGTVGQPLRGVSVELQQASTCPDSTLEHPAPCYSSVQLLNMQHDSRVRRSASLDTANCVSCIVAGR